MGAPILPIPNIPVAALHTLLYVVLHCRAGLLHCPQDPDISPECQVVPVAEEVPVILCSYCSAKRNKVAHNDTPDVIRDDHHQFDLERGGTDRLPPW